MTNTDERRARAMYETDSRRALAIVKARFEHDHGDEAAAELPSHKWLPLAAKCEHEAEAIRASDEAAGMVMVPKTVVELLGVHHRHHLQKGIIGLPDGKGGWIEIDNGAEYSDSALYIETDAMLAVLAWKEE